MMLQNPFVFGLNHVKMAQLRKENQDKLGSDDGIMRIHHSFNLYNRRTEFPYDAVPNACCLNPNEKADDYD